MYELSRVRLFSVGPAGARYQDVCLDLRGVGPVVRGAARQEDLFAAEGTDAGSAGAAPGADARSAGAPLGAAARSAGAPLGTEHVPRRPAPASVLFLENGGGKSVLLKLVFSVLLPGRRQVVGTTSTTVLEKFVLAEDVAHVALEWMHTVTGALLVTGKVSQWRGHVASADPEKLADAWYSFRPGPGFGLDDLPFTHDRRRVAGSAFKDRLFEAYRARPDRELVWETGQRDWTRHLVDVGLDPELFRYQRTMNAGEGEAADAFSFPNDEAFVDFLLRAVLDPDEPQGLADLVAGYATKLAQREDLETERAFVDGTLERLGPLVEAERTAELAREREAGARRGGRELAASLVRRKAVEDERLSTAREALDVAEEAEQSAGRTERRLGEVVTELRRLTAGLELEHAQRAEEQARREHDAAQETVEAWQAVEPVLRHQIEAAEAGRLRRLLDEEQERARPALRARQDAARALAAGLRAVAADADRAAQGASESARAASDRAEAARETEIEATSDVASRESAAAQARSGRDVIAGRVAAAVREGLLTAPGPGRDPGDDDVTAAAATARGEAGAAARAVSDLHTGLDDLRRARRAADTRRGAAARAEQDARAASSAAGEAHAAAVSERDALAAEPRLAELLGVETVRPADDADALVEHLSSAVGSAEGERTELLAAQARDQRALRSLGAGGLLPEPPEIEDVLGVLEDAGITAWSGWRYLTMLPESDRVATIERLPHLAGGVLLNNADDGPRARAEIEAARLLPCAVVAVGSTAAVAGGEAAAGVQLVVPPNPAMFDADAADAARENLTRETTARSARLDELAALLDTDGRLLARLRGWRERRPTLDELAGTLERARAAHAEAAEALTAVDAEITDLDERADDLEQDRPRREEAAALGRERSEALDALAAEVARRPELEEDLRAATSAAEHARERAAVARTGAERARDDAGEAQRSRDRHTAVADRAREELAELPLDDGGDGDDGGGDGGGEPGAGTGADERSLAVLQAEFRRAEAAYASSEVDTDLRQELAAAERAAGSARTAVDALTAAARDGAEALLRSPEAADVGSRRSAADQARTALARHRDAVQKAASATAVASAATQGPPGTPRSVEPYGPPRDTEHGRELIDRADTDRRAAEADAERTRHRARAERDEVRRIEHAAEGFGHIVAGLDGAGEPEEHEHPAEPFAGDVGAGVQAWKQRQVTVRATADERAAAEKEVRAAVDAVAQFAQDPRFSALTIPVRRHIGGVARADMPGLAPDWQKALAPRLRSLDDDLANIDRHRSGIVTRLAGMVGEALRTLRLAQRLSELPDGLSDWSGQQFLRIRFDTVDDEVLRHALGEVVDRTAEAGTTGSSPRDRRDGMSLLLRGVRAAMPRGVRVEMLKPDAVLRTERLRVSEIRDVFSGGQQLTAAIVLYCTMAALRAHQRGEGRRPHAGVLFLDNPIGRASAGYLLELQFGVAQALGVQLVYTTGLFDAGALSTFPLLIRLRNDADLRAGRKYLSVDDRIAHTLDELPDPDGTGGVTATRLFRRPDPATT
ncbi:hypothetical protein [Pseudonocardia sp. KRD291]|uniref:hypothetical protein n=1 Tax=Pseudonocardia sp. KRD291 TaxID=2792007 RepID=UPI001C4A0D11|nr:hypothetical protein [Pseudonocardia sp. KRD291]MBW0104482.1 hypothetical protein [Pseudonocardia sp. KRD291]